MYLSGMTPTIHRNEIVSRLRSGSPISLVETLQPQHYEQGHLPGAVHLHFSEVEERAAALLPDRDALIVTYCSNAACSNSRVAAEKLAKLGYTDVRRYEAGKQDWAEAGLELETGGVPA
jgi:rhodanese-related sulfurtransferase